MGKIKKILENELVEGTQATDVYPITSTKAVYDTDNIMLDTYIQHLKKTHTFAGVATPSTNPDALDHRVFYLACENGNYPGFNDINVNNEVAVFTWSSGKWTKTTINIAEAIAPTLNIKADKKELAKKVDLEEFNNTVSGINANIATKANTQDVTKAIGELQDKIGDRVVVSGNVTNNPDEEDITAEGDTPQTQVLKLKDRTYDSLNASGKGYKILRKNWQSINGERKNVLTQDMINEPNTIYEIRYDFDLNVEEVTIPDNCALIFNGGSLKNGILNGNNVNIISQNTTIFNNIHGTLQLTNDRFYTIWFGNDTKSVNDSTQLVVKDTTLVLPQDIIHNDTIIIEKYNLEWISGKTTLNDKPFLQIINQCKSINFEGSYINNTNEYDGDVIILGGNASKPGAIITPIISYFNLGNIKNSNSYRCNGLTIRFTDTKEYLYDYNISITGVNLKNVINFEIQQGSNITDNKFTITSWQSINAINFVNTQEFNSISHILGHNTNTFNVFYQDSNNHPSIASKVLNIENYDLINAKELNGEGLCIEYSLWDTGAKSKFIDYIPNAVYKNKNNISTFNSHFDFHGNNDYSPLDRSFYTSNSFTNIFVDSVTREKLSHSMINISGDTREEFIKNFITTLVKLYNRNIHIRIPFSSTTGYLAVVRGTINKLFYFNDVKSLINMESFGILDIDLFGTELNVKEKERWVGLKVKFENSDISTYFVVNFTYHYEETEIIFDEFNVEPTVTISTSAHGKTNPKFPHLYSSYFNTSVKKQVFWNGEKWIDSSGVAYNVTSSGSYSRKPTEEGDINIGYGYFCTDRKTTEGNTNGIMIYYKGNGVWVDALGRVIE